MRFEDEVILLKIGVQDIYKFNTLLYYVNCYNYMLENVSKEETLYFIAFLRGIFMQCAMQAKKPIKVYKFGSATRLTISYLINIDYKSLLG